jgi:hypothetical protein
MSIELLSEGDEVGRVKEEGICLRLESFYVGVAPERESEDDTEDDTMSRLDRQLP